MFRQFVCAVLAAVVALVARPTQTQAQKALVYCPAGDAAGCGKVVAALASRFEAVDRAFDGANGTVDLATADLAHYAVLVVPSLADGEQAAPYALLRANAGRLKMAVTGRVAVFSGAPDQGATNRGAKDALIANLATWAAAGHRAKSGLVGLVAFQDLSENAAARYDWVSAISPVAVSADTELRSWRAVKAMRAGASSLLRDGEREIAYPNMASFGLHIDKGSSARTMVGAVGGEAGQTVLVTHANADEATSGGNGMIMSAVAGGDTTWITTDKQDYLPGDTVTFTGGNWAPGDTVRITIHEDPHWVPEHQDRQVVAVAGQDGKFTNRSFVIHVNDFGVTFTATAVGSPSGRTATHVFTDGNSTVTGTVLDATTNLPISGAVVKCDLTNGCNNLFADTTDANGNYLFTVNYAGNTANITLTVSRLGYTTHTTPQFCVATNSSHATTTCPTSVTRNISLTPSAEATSTTVTTATSTYAAASVTLSATVSSTASTPSVVNSGTVTFTVKQGATVIGAATTSGTVSSGTASASYALPAGIAVGNYSVEATYNPGPGFLGSNGSGTLTIGKAATTTTVTCTGGPFTFTGAAQTPCSASVTGPGGLNQPLTVVYQDNTNAGTATASASYAETANYLGSNDSETFAIGKAATTTTVTCTGGPFTYDGSPKTPCSASVTGPNSLNESLTVSYQNNTGAGTATASASYAATANYLGSSDTETFSIGKATSTVTVTCPADADAPTYTGSPLTPCTAAATGAGGLNQALTPTYTNNTNAGTGTASASATFDGDDNHSGNTGSATFSIKKASSTTTVTCTGGPFVYDGNAKTPCSATATGAGGLNVAVTPVNYSDNTNAGTANASATYLGDANHEGSSGSTTFTIDKADQTITWSNPTDIVYGTQLGNTQLNATVAGVTGGTAPGALTYTPATGTLLDAGNGQTLTVNAAETANYKTASKSVAINVLKKELTASITASGKTYDGTTAVVGAVSCDVAVKVGSDDVDCSASGAAFDDPNAGSRTVTATVALIGTKAGNYVLQSASASVSATIAPRPITVKAVDVQITWANPLPSYTYNGIELTAGTTLAGTEQLTVLGTSSFSTELPSPPVNAGAYPINVTGLANGNYTISYAQGSARGKLIVLDRTAPVATITELNPVAIGTSATLKVNISDVNSGNSNVVEWKYSIDGVDQAPVTVPAPQSPNVNVQATIAASTATDVMTICAYGKDEAGNWSVSNCALLAVYDPKAGFVTGGGWIMSPKGAYTADKELEGKANFGFVSKYQKGATTPSGETEFQFHTATFRFKSTSYQWLVVSGPKAQYKGVGTINGAGEYNFLLTATDGQVNGGGNIDRFRIKITDRDGNVIYDNVPTAGDALDSANPQVIAGGSIQVHAK